MAEAGRGSEILAEDQEAWDADPSRILDEEIDLSITAGMDPTDAVSTLPSRDR